MDGGTAAIGARCTESDAAAVAGTGGVAAETGDGDREPAPAAATRDGEAEAGPVTPAAVVVAGAADAARSCTCSLLAIAPGTDEPFWPRTTTGLNTGSVATGGRRGTRRARVSTTT